MEEMLQTLSVIAKRNSFFVRRIRFPVGWGKEEDGLPEGLQSSHCHANDHLPSNIPVISSDIVSN